MQTGYSEVTLVVTPQNVVKAINTHMDDGYILDGFNPVYKRRWCLWWNLLYEIHFIKYETA